MGDQFMHGLSVSAAVTFTSQRGPNAVLYLS